MPGSFKPKNPNITSVTEVYSIVKWASKNNKIDEKTNCLSNNTDGIWIQSEFSFFDFNIFFIFSRSC